MLKLVKRIVRRLFAQFGLVLFKRSTGIFVREDETPALAVRLCGVAEPTVVDGGSHEGSMVDAIRAQSPKAQFICFEPDPALCEKLRRKFSGDRGVQIVQAALSAASGTAAFNVNRSRACNSLMSSAGAAVGKLGDLMATMERIEVEVTTIDEGLAKLGVATCDILKLDLQGNEINALVGAAQALKSAKVVVVEVWYAPIYEGMVNYIEIFDLMRARGFCLYALAGLHYSTTGRLLWSDAVFIRSDSAEAAKHLTIV